MNKRLLLLATALLCLVSGCGQGLPAVEESGIQFWTTESTGYILDAGQTLWAYGDNCNGELGVGNDVEHTAVPVRVLKDVSRFYGQGGGYQVALKKDGSVWKWGRYNTQIKDTVPPVSAY